MTPLDRMIDQNVRCLRCGAPREARCGCFMTLRCPECKTTLMVAHDPLQGDPAGTTEVIAPCPSCMSSDDPRYVITYLDAEGKVLDTITYLDRVDDAAAVQ